MLGFGKIPPSLNVKLLIVLDEMKPKNVEFGLVADVKLMISPLSNDRVAVKEGTCVYASEKSAPKARAPLANCIPRGTAESKL
jgi:hypothetical protein